MVWQREDVREPISRLIWGENGRLGFIVDQRTISGVQGQIKPSARLFEISALSTLLSGQSFGQELPGILLSPDFSPHALRQDGDVLPNSGGLSSSFRAITPRKHADLPLAMAMGGCTGSEIIYRHTDDMPCEYGGRLRRRRFQRSARDLVQLWGLSVRTKTATHGGILTVRPDGA